MARKSAIRRQVRKRPPPEYTVTVVPVPPDPKVAKAVLKWLANRVR
jgi:hypothetical protein